LAAPSAFSGNPSAGLPAVATASYNPQTGAYMGGDGHLYQQTDLTAGPPKEWKDLVLAPG
jgi:hypothetical protein